MRTGIAKFEELSNFPLAYTEANVDDEEPEKTVTRLFLLSIWIAG